MRKPIFLAVSLLALSCGNVQTGLDTTFGTSGFAVTDFAGGDDEVLAVAVQSDGKIVAVGVARNGAGDDFAIARYTTAGVLDTSFSDDGKLLVDFNSRDDRAQGVVIQSDGKIVVVGTSATSSASAMALLRLSSNGTLDPLFGTAGKTMLEVEGNQTVGRAMALLSDGKLLVAGATNATKYEPVVARFTTTGTLDTAFGTAGATRLAMGTIEDRAYAMAVRSNGKIVLVGSSTGASSNQNIAVGQLNTDGSVDTSFGSTGKLTIDVPQLDASSLKRNDIAYSVMTMADGQLLIGADSSSTARYGVLVRVTSNGTLDLTYGSTGYQRLTQTDATFQYAAGISPINGEHWFIGKTTKGSATQPALARATGSGALVGTMATLSPTGNSAGNALTTQSDSKVIGGGYATATTGRDFLVFRYGL